ncbi:MAG: hypothetical protein QOF02_31 [Blastocatellia bacterium]|jgi:hypothetical protein|nr:hypothetical protein [Blastocatellia bacterium]
MPKVKVKLNFNALSISEKITRARIIVQNMTANTVNFPNPTPKLAEVTAVIDAAEQAYNAALTARDISKQRTAELEQQEDALDEMASRLVGFVESASGGKEDIILSAGMDVRAPSLASGQPPAIPSSLAPTTGDKDGDVDLSWNASSNARSYVVQSSQTPTVETSWTQAAIVTTSKTTISGLVSGTKYWFRVAAVGGGGQSGWSDPAVKMAP